VSYNKRIREKDALDGGWMYMEHCRMMRRTISLLLAVFLIFTMFAGGALAAEDGMIRVKLTRLGTRQSLTFKTNCAYSIGGNSSKVIPSGASCTVALSGGGLTLTVNGVHAASGVSLELKRGASGGTKGVTFTSPSYSGIYSGDLLFSVSSGAIQPVLRAYIEDYVVGVVICEMGNSFPVEALKAQAIAARTYAMMMKKSSGSYDLVDNTNAQAYRGYDAGKTNVIEAVNATRGMVAYYNGQLARMYYGASNGGQMEPSGNVWSNDLPYLLQKDDPYDYENTASVKKSYTFKKNFNANSLPASVENAMKNAIAGELAKLGLQADAGSVIINTIDAMNLHSPRYAGASRTYQKVRFTATVTLASNGEQGQIAFDLATYDLLEGALSLSINTSKNETYEITEDADSFTLTARRYGHGVGMSQRGAQWMASKYGKSCREILEFYFPGLNYKTVNYADSTGNYSGGSLGSGDADTNDNTQMPEESDGVYGVVRLSSGSSKLNMRAKPSTSGDILGMIPNGAKVEVLATNDGWARIRYSGLTGYVMLSYLERVGGETVQPTATPVPTPGSGSGNARYAVLSLSSSTGKMNVRQGPSTSTSSIGVIPHGTRLEVLGETGEWSFIRVNNRTGYVKTQYLVFDDTLVPAPTTAPTPNATQAPSAGQYAVLTLSSTSAKMHVRKGPSTSSESLGTIPHGTRLELLGVEGEWACVGLNGNVGYIKKQYLKVEQGSTMPENTIPTPTATPAPSTAPTPAYIAYKTAYIMIDTSDGNIPVYASPSHNAKVIASLKYKDAVKVIAVQDGWAQIMLDDTYGFIDNGILMYVIGGENDDSRVEHWGEFISTPTPAPAVTPKPTQNAAAGKGYAVLTLASSSSKMNVRLGPSTGTPSVCVIPHGTYLEVLGQTGEWSNVRVNGKEGYVKTKYLSMVGGAATGSTPMATHAPAATPTPLYIDYKTAYVIIVTENDNVPVYMSPSHNAKIIASLKYKDAVKVIAVQDGWAQIILDDTYAFIDNDILMYLVGGDNDDSRVEHWGEFVATPTPVPTQAPTPAPTQVPEAAEKPESGDENGTYATVKLSNSSSKLNVRAEANTSSDIVGRVTNGMRVEVLGTNGKWAKIRVNDTVGYVMKSYLVLEEKTEDEEDEELPEFGSTPAPTAKPSQNTDVMFYALVTLDDEDGKLGVRSRASSSASVILRVPNNTVFEVLDYNDSWAKVRLDNTVGYVSRSYLERAENTAVALRNIIVYSQPDSAGTSIGRIEKDVRVAVDAVRGDWARIYYNGGWGYVSEAELKEDR